MGKYVLAAGIIVGLAWYVLLPPRAATVPPAPTALAQPVRGAIHVHTRSSDGTGSVEEVAGAAARAGLAFVVFTDHGDATRIPNPPRYVDGVLCIDAVEISTEGGHLVVLGLPQAPYPLGGEARDVVEDVGRLGGFAIAAHPASQKAELRWSDWSAPVDGLEWLNGDSEWRDESRWSLARVLFTYAGRRPETLATLLDRPEALLRQWDALTARRRVVAVAAADAHARIGIRSVGEPYDNGVFLRVPSYENVFRTFSIALPDLRLTRDPAADAALVLDAIRKGQVYSAVDALAAPSALSFTAVSGGMVAGMGAALPSAEPATLRVTALAPPGARIALLKDGVEVASADGQALEHAAPAGAGVYRVEIALSGAPGQPPVPWMLSNPIYIGRHGDETAVTDPPPAPTQFAVQYDDGPADDWRVETSARSLGAIDVLQAVEGMELGFRFALGGPMGESPFAAMVMPAAPAIAGHDRLMFTARATRPMRVSVQLRVPGSDAGERWHRSVYLDTTPREITILFDDMRPRGVTRAPRPVLADVRSVLFVVDTVNADTGSNGEFFVDDVKYAR